MSKNLIIVESPNKIHTISEFVGSDYEIMATVGHIRELNVTNGYNKETFDPNWSVIKEKKGNKSKATLIKEIKKAADEADVVYLATDPDREGEAISWHVWDILSNEDKKKCRRITFNEITKPAVLNAIQNYREIDMNLVDSQFARRIIDRMVGYDLSKLIKQKLKEKSAGRVQSVALLFLVDRQLERDAFVKSWWWEIDSLLTFQAKELDLKTLPYQVEEYQSESKGPNFRFAHKQDAELALSKLGPNFTVTNISAPKLSKLDSYKAITTDKLLQLASLQLNWKPRKTTLIAQELFEGVEIDGVYQALISYPRTDSERLSDEFIDNTKQYISQTYGSQYVTTNSSLDKTQKNKTNVQDAHEAIRPIDVATTPTYLKDKISKDCYDLYNLIWTRTMMILMASPLINRYVISLTNNGFGFETTHKQLIFDGYYVLPQFEKTKNNLSRGESSFEVGKEYSAQSIELSEHEKLPPPYYTEASLIVALKDAGVGRPSTYSQMASIGVERGYVKVENHYLIPNDNGMLIIQSLRKAFPDIITPKFTANMETNLDKIANGEENWKEYLHEFAPAFQSEFQNAKETMEKIPDEPTGRVCPNCGKELFYRISRYKTKFIGCSGFPDCKYMESLPKEQKILDELCPECNHPLIIRKNKKGQEFIACTGFPKCHYMRGLNEEKKS